MKIEASDKEVQDIFSLGYFSIPRFQRPYSWSSEEVESFWDDVILGNSENYFIGSMVVFQTKKPYFGIVDGQQRLTTITLILSAIRNAFKELGEKDLALGVHKYIEKANIDNKDEYVLNAETSFPYLQNKIQKYDSFGVNFEAGSEEKTLEVAYDIIKNKMKLAIPELANGPSQLSLLGEDIEGIINILKSYRDKVLSLKLVFIQMDNEDDAYLIFETLNARGRDLTTVDLVKNLILKSVKAENISMDGAKEAWALLVNKFDSFDDPNTINHFLVHYWCATYSYCTDKKLFSEIKSLSVKDNSFAEKLLCDFCEDAPCYVSLINPDLAEWKREELEVKNSLKALNIFKVKQQTAFTLALLRAYKNGVVTLRNLIKVISKIESFHYCFNAITSQRSSGVIASTYSRLAIKLSSIRNSQDIQPVFNELNAFLISKIPDRDEFIIKFCDIGYSSKDTKDKAVVRYTLSKLVPANAECLPVDFSNLTIEHILPERAKSASSSADISNIGNLILLDGKVNSVDLGGREPAEKFKIMRESNYSFGAAILDPQDNWGASEIKKRGQAMADHIYSEVLKCFR